MRFSIEKLLQCSVIIVVGLLLCVACSRKPEVKPTVEKPEVRAIVKTKFGDIEITFLPDVAPGHVENFIKLAKEGLYNGTIFHRVIPGFMIQGGDPNTKNSLKKDTYGQGGPGYTIKAEFSDLPHKRGVVSMARAEDPDTAGSQFFIVVENSPYLDGKYTIFGKVTKGIGVADKIANEPRDERDNPNTRVEMTVIIVDDVPESKPVSDPKPVPDSEPVLE